MNALYEDLASVIAAKDSRTGIERIEFDYSAEMSRVLDGVSYAILGPNTIFIPQQKKRYLDRSIYPYGPAEVARAYLSYIGAARKAPWQLPAGMLTAPPKVFRPEFAESREWAYVDLRSAYWQLYHAASFDMSYGLGFMGRRLTRGRVEFKRCEEWREDKLARNSVWGTIIADKMRVWSEGALEVIDVRGRFTAPHLALWVQHQLHAVCSDIMSSTSSPLWNDDGFLLPKGTEGEWIEYLAEHWQIEATVKEVGTGNVWGPGNYEWRESGRKVPRRPVDTRADLSAEQIETIRLGRLANLQAHSCHG